MTLESGTRLGPYEIVAPIGAGGMGEVYKAKDTRLDRTVAIKVLPEHLAESSERKARFEREAKAISQLNHPHICTLYDVHLRQGYGGQVGDAGDLDYMVMEYIEGETLADRLKRGALKLDQALEYGIQIVDALVKAHRAGIVHRDLKPGNMMLTQAGAKLLDFGLARLLEEDDAIESSDAPTRQKHLTQEESIIGTLQYMAPEQLERKRADARTDIFAFGAVLYEMLTGQKAFSGSSQASLIGAILKEEPPVASTHQILSPAILDRTIGKCLAKDPDFRWQSARDLHDELKWIANGESEVAGTTRAHRGWSASRGAAMVLAMTVALAVGRYWGGTPDRDSITTRFEVNLEEPLAVPPLMPAVALSPDGRLLVYVAGSPGSRQLYLRPMNEAEGRAVPGTEDATAPFFSTDGGWVGFFARGKLKKVSLSTGSVADICDTPVRPFGATWGRDDSIILAWGDERSEQGLRRVSSDGGVPEILTTLDREAGETGHFWPALLPGRQQLLFTVRFESGSFDDARIAVYSLESGETKYLQQGGTFARYLAPGHLIFARGRTLHALPFDLDRLEPTGVAVPIIENVAMLRYQGAVQYALSEEGSLVYGPEPTQTSVVSIDRQGNVEPISNSASEIIGMEPRLSPDGRRLATTVAEEDLAIWIAELERGTFARLTFGGLDTAPVWTPDAQRITYSAFNDIYWISADGSGQPEPLLVDGADRIGGYPASWSPDGEILAFNRESADRLDIWTLRLGEEPAPFLNGPFDEVSPAFSPDGRFLAYVSNESGRNEVYVRSFPGPGGKWPISSDGGTQPVWAPDGSELFYRDNEKMIAVPIQTKNGFAPGIPVVLFEHRYVLSPPNVAEYSVTPDGKRFIMAGGFTFALPRLNMVLNWAEELEALAPTSN